MIVDFRPMDEMVNPGADAFLRGTQSRLVSFVCDGTIMAC